MKLKTALLFLFLIPFIFIHKSYAQTEPNRIKSIINISPIILDTSLQKGRTQTYTYKITNLLDEALGVRINVEDFAPYADESPNEQSSITSPILKWSTLDQENIIINPKEKKTITLTINTPPDTKDGGYYEAVFFTPIYLKTDSSEPKNVVSRIGALFFGTLGPINYNDLISKVAVKNLKLGPLLENSNGEIKFTVQNSYFNHFSAKPFLTISPLLGKNQRIELTEKRVLPEKGRIWDEKFKLASPHHLIYKANLAVSVGQGHYVYKNTYFLVFPWKVVLVITLVICTVTFIYFRRIQLKRALKVLISGK